MKNDLLQPFQLALAESETSCGRPLSDKEIEMFCRYYEMVLRWNPRIHLTTVIEPAEFAHRHILESIFTAQHLQNTVTNVLDLGSGAGVPGIPVAILRPDLSVTLVDSDKKKAVFLKEAADMLSLTNLTVMNQRIESLPEAGANVCLTARAVEKMTSLIGLIFRQNPAAAQFLLLGGSDLETAIAQNLPESLQQQSFLLPFSANRWLFSLTRST